MSVDTSHPIGFIPRHPPPSKYLKVRAHYKKEKVFNRVFLSQELEGTSPQPKVADRRISTSSTLTQNGENTGKAIWALVFSKDGRYLAAAGQDRKVRVWAVISTPEEREDTDAENEATPVDAHDHPQLNAPVFQQKPIRVYEGHTGSILDLSWSKVGAMRHIIIPEKAMLILSRTISFFPPRWIRQFDFGIYLARNVSAVSSTVIS